MRLNFYAPVTGMNKPFHIFTPLLLLLLTHNVLASQTNKTAHNDESISIIGFRWDHIETPMMVSFWLIMASLAKICFHINQKFGEALPDSALLISMAISFVWTRPFSFLYLLPPIIFDAGYFMPNRQLFENFGSIMMFAVVGTIWNTIAIGLTLGFCSSLGWFTIPVSYVEAFLFSSLISAVDPVAVITEIHVNEFLFINVFGEAIFNDGIAAALFQIFNKMILVGTEKLNAVSYAVFSGSFVLVALGGVFIGITMALVCSIATRFTQRVKIVGPVFIFVIPYVSYLIAELFGLSAILAICACGIVMKQYVKGNITHEAAVSVKYFVKMLAQSSETVVFMFLGLSTMSNHQHFDLWFCVVTVIACLIYRTIGVLIQCAILNRTRNKKFTLQDQFILSYGGLRGAIAFGLLSSVPDSVAGKDMFATATIVVICFTVFLQGATIRPLLSLLKVEKAEDRQFTMIENVYAKYFDYTMTGIEDIVGQKGQHSIRDWFERLNAKVLKPLLVKHTKRNVFDASQIVRAYNKITLQEAMDVMRVDKRKPISIKSAPAQDHGSQTPPQRKTTLDAFLASQENTEALYEMFSQLLDRKLADFQNRTPSLNSADNGQNHADNDDIKDDYIAAIRSSSPTKQQHQRLQVPDSRLAGGRSEPMRPMSRRARRLSQPIIPSSNSQPVFTLSRDGFMQQEEEI
ncbi:Sodium/hydrogen exchanger [Aphelenchoides bicaudatus]|nr:Sodium/hydrogen exchanger [Aphelenchoides bicaudatus]